MPNFSFLLQYVTSQVAAGTQIFDLTSPTHLYIKILLHFIMEELMTHLYFIWLTEYVQNSLKEKLK